MNIDAIATTANELMDQHLPDIQTCLFKKPSFLIHLNAVWLKTFLDIYVRVKTHSYPCLHRPGEVNVIITLLRALINDRAHAFMDAFMDGCH